MERTYVAHCWKEACQSNYLLYFKADATDAMANAGQLTLGFGAVGIGIVENLNVILKRAYDDQTGPGGGGGWMLGAKQVEEEADVVLQN